VTINVEHDTVTVTPDKPATPSVPDGPKFPAGTYADQLNHTYTRTINYLDSKTNEPVATSVVQPVKASRTALVDKVTGQLKGYVDAQGNLLTGDGWTAVASPKVSGYQNPEITEVAAAKVNPNDPSSNQTVNVYYTPEIIDPNDPTPDHPTDPTTPENPTTPTTSANPGTPGVVPGTSQPGQSVVPTQTGKQVTPAKDSHNAQQLPQTGNNNQAAVLGLGMGAVASLLGFLGLNKKREN
jgi:LPXTG-motif cell wall-anchored protein